MIEKLPTYGGQAVIEGVMMRGSQALAIAVRDPKGEIQLNTKPLGNLYRGRLSKLPLVRGLLGLWDALGLGMQALTYSANIAAGEEVKVEGPTMWGTVALSLLFSIGLFFLAPAAAGAGVDYLLKDALGSVSTETAGWVGNLAEGLIRLCLIVGYIWAIGFIPDIKRLYGYHGAEHKTINAFESGAPLTPESVAQFPLEHPRCGTAFLLVVVVLSILIFSLLGPLDWPVRLASRVLLVPVLAAIAYEYLRFTARYMSNPFIRAIVAPNLLMQRLTTREPDLKMLEVSIAAFEAMRKQEVGEPQVR
ncbi:MAG TPA: DUF1385 domain-containing protein [Anaerolineales bacterium]|nr:DUF1385 domain-containing protein [Anaerolineales bacterium]